MFKIAHVFLFNFSRGINQFDLHPNFAALGAKSIALAEQGHVNPEDSTLHCGVARPTPRSVAPEHHACLLLHLRAAERVFG